MKTTFKQLLTDLVVGKQVLLHKYNYNLCSWVRYSSYRRDEEFLNYSYGGSEYATIVGVNLDTDGDEGQIILDLDENSPTEWIDFYLEQLIELRES